MALQASTDRPRRPKDRRDTILAVASEHFHRRGYAGTSLDELAGALGITGPALYRHFRNKGDLYTTVLDLNLQQLEACLADAATLDDALRGLARIGVEHPTIGLLWSTERRRRLVDPDRAIENRLASAVRALEALLAQPIDGEVSWIIARLALAVMSSTGFYESPLSTAEQVAALTGTLRKVVEFRPVDPLETLEVGAENPMAKPWISRRAALLDAGAALVVQEGGYQAVTMEKIAAAVGISAASVYSDFAGKADLLAAAFVRVVELALAALQSATAQATTAEDALHRAVATTLGISAEHPSWSGTLIDELQNLPAEGRDQVLSASDRFLGEWAAICAAVAPFADPDTVQVRMRSMLGIVDDRALAATLGHRVMTVDDTAVLALRLLRD